MGWIINQENGAVQDNWDINKAPTSSAAEDMRGMEEFSMGGWEVKARRGAEGGEALITYPINGYDWTKISNKLQYNSWMQEINMSHLHGHE